MCPGGVCVQEGVCVQGGCAQGCVCAGGFMLASNGADTPPVDRITDRYKNISLSQSSFASGKDGNVFSTVI